MLVDNMDYQKQQQSGGGLQDDAFYDLLSSTAMANANKHQQQQQLPQEQQHQHQFEQQQQQQQAFDSRNEEPLLPSYDFQPNSSSYGSSAVSNGEEKAPGMAPVVSSYPSGSPFQSSRQHLPIPSFVETSPARQERGSNSSDAAATVAVVEQTMKKYMDSMMHMMEGVTGRIGQLESSTRRLEQMVTEFKGLSEKTQGAAGGKLLLIETMLSEVQRGVQDLRTKQEAVELQANMRKVILSEDSIAATTAHNQASLEPPPPQSPRAPQLPETPTYPPHHGHHPHHPPPPPPPYMVPSQLVGLPAPPPPPAGHQEPQYPLPQQGGPPPPQYYGQHPQPHHQQQQGPPPPPQQPQQQQQQQGPPPPPPPPAHSHGPPPFSHPSEIPPYGAPPQGPYKGQSVPFGQEVPAAYGNRPQQGPPPSGPPMYDQSGLMPPYQSQGRPAAPVYEQRQEQQMGGPPSGYSNPGYRMAQQVPSAPSSGSGGYPRLPSAQPVQHAMPTGREREGSPASAGGAPLSTNRLSVDEVIDKVAVMGFSKDQVRAVVRRLTENGQSVDLNVVLDKLMNGEAGQQQGKSWFRG